MAYPTTLALITALWAGAPRTKAIALWSAVGGAMAAIGPLVAGFLLGEFWWGSVFLVTLPLAAIALVLAARLRARPTSTRPTDSVDHLGGVMSIIAVGALVIGITFAPEPGEAAIAVGLLAVAVLAAAAFVRAPASGAEPALRPRHRRHGASSGWRPLGGIVVFGSLMGAMFVGQQYLQNVLGYSTLEAGASILPAAVFMVIVAPRSAHLVETRGARFTLLAGVRVLLPRASSRCWSCGPTTRRTGRWRWPTRSSASASGSPAHPPRTSLTSSVPVDRAGMASGTADLQRDLGGAILQSILGALLTAGYAAAFTAEIAASPQASQVSETTQSQLLRSYSSAEATAQQYPQYADQITTAAHERPSPRARTGPTWPARSRSRWARCWWRSCSPATTTSGGCWPSTPRRTPADGAPASGARSASGSAVVSLGVRGGTRSCASMRSRRSCSAVRCWSSSGASIGAFASGELDAARRRAAWST